MGAIAEEAAAAHKARGNEHFKSGDDAAAIEQYSKGVALCGDTPSLAATRVALLANRAACHLRRGDHVSCVMDCDAALHVDGRAATARGLRDAARGRYVHPAW